MSGHLYYSEDCLTRRGLDQCILLLVLVYYSSVIKLLLLLICWFLSFMLLLVSNTLLLLACNIINLVLSSFPSADSYENDILSL